MSAPRRLAARMAASLLLLLASPIFASTIVDAEFASDLVPGPVPYSVLLPPGYEQLKEPVPLVFDLHGGGGDRTQLKRWQKVYDELWERKEIPPLVAVTPSVTQRCFYMDYRDGTEKWETFLMGPFLDHLREKYNVRRDREGLMATGASMGGMGSLRLAFKYPDRFLAVASMEPGIEPLLKFSDMQPKHRFWRGDELFDLAYGKPVDEAYWAANNPASIAAADPERLKKSGLQIYVECGDEDQFWLYEGSEFLHRVLWDARIRHEYHLVRGADHTGTSLGDRKREAMRFLARAMKPWEESPRTKETNDKLDPLKARIQGTDHYHETPEKPTL